MNHPVYCCILALSLSVTFFIKSQQSIERPIEYNEITKAFLKIWNPTFPIPSLKRLAAQAYIMHAKQKKDLALLEFPSIPQEIRSILRAEFNLSDLAEAISFFGGTFLQAGESPNEPTTKTANIKNLRFKFITPSGLYFIESDGNETYFYKLTEEGAHLIGSSEGKIYSHSLDDEYCMLIKNDQSFTFFHVSTNTVLSGPDTQHLKRAAFVIKNNTCSVVEETDLFEQTNDSTYRYILKKCYTNAHIFLVGERGLTDKQLPESVFLSKRNINSSEPLCRIMPQVFDEPEEFSKNNAHFRDCLLNQIETGNCFDNKKGSLFIIKGFRGEFVIINVPKLGTKDEMSFYRLRDLKRRNPFYLPDKIKVECSAISSSGRYVLIVTDDSAISRGENYHIVHLYDLHTKNWAMVCRARPIQYICFSPHETAIFVLTDDHFFVLHISDFGSSWSLRHIQTLCDIAKQCKNDCPIIETMFDIEDTAPIPRISWEKVLQNIKIIENNELRSLLRIRLGIGPIMDEPELYLESAEESQ